MIEARCTTCGETFVPDGEDDLEHIEREDGTPCGGPGEITRAVVLDGLSRTPGPDEVGPVTVLSGSEEDSG